MNEETSKIVKLVKEIHGPIPDELGKIMDIPITESLTKQELLAVIWYMRKDFENKDAYNFYHLF